MKTTNFLTTITAAIFLIASASVASANGDASGDVGGGSLDEGGSVGDSTQCYGYRC